MPAALPAPPQQSLPAAFRYPRLMRRIERLINLIAALLEARRPMTAEEIRREIAGYDQGGHDAFRRTFERDKEALRVMGIPIERRATEPFGTTDGYIIPKARYYLPELDLEADELAALRIAADAILGSADAAEAGLMKLAVDADTAPAAGPRIVWGADLAAEEPQLAAIYTAVLERGVLAFPYRRAGEDASRRRTVEPYGLVHRRGHWYLVGRDRDRDAVRAFKVSRVGAPIRRLEGSFASPAGFDAAAYLAGEAWEVGRDEPATATVTFSAALRWWAEQNLPDAPRREATGGALQVDLPVANVDALVSWVIGFGGEATIAGPEAARRRLMDHLRPVLESAP
jgi:proteasome accessory factor B